MSDGCAMKGLFVLQWHDTELPHLDLGIELAGELACWRLDGTPSFDPDETVGAVRLENRPLDYLGFSGIALGLDCGDGALDVCDQGLAHSLRRDRSGRPVTITAAVDAGESLIWLEGSTLQGGWGLVRADERWQLTKAPDLVARGARSLGLRSPAGRLAHLG